MSSETIALRQAQHGEELALAELRVSAMRESLEAAGRFDPIRARARFLESVARVEFVPGGPMNWMKSIASMQCGGWSGQSGAKTWVCSGPKAGAVALA